MAKLWTGSKTWQGNTTPVAGTKYLVGASGGKCSYQTFSAGQTKRCLVSNGANGNITYQNVTLPPENQALYNNVKSLMDRAFSAMSGRETTDCSPCGIAQNSQVSSWFRISKCTYSWTSTGLTVTGGNKLIGDTYQVDSGYGFLFGRQYSPSNHGIHTDLGSLDSEITNFNNANQNKLMFRSCNAFYMTGDGSDTTYYKYTGPCYFQRIVVRTDAKDYDAHIGLQLTRTQLSTDSTGRIGLPATDDYVIFANALSGGSNTCTFTI